MSVPVRAHRVYTRELWSQAWTERPQLFAEHATWCCSPEMPEAVLYWNYSDRIMGYGENTFAVRAKVDYLHAYVKIEVDQENEGTLCWYGIIKEEMDERRGGFETNISSGRQFFKAYGLEWLLDRAQLTSSWVLNATSEDTEIKRCIGFNLGGGDEKSGRFSPNMSASAGAKNAFIFTDTFANAEPWQAYAIVDYLLTYQSPKDLGGEVQVPFVLDPDYSESLFSLSWWKVQLAYEGRSVKEVLDAIMHRNRLISYKVTVDEDTNQILVQPFTFNEEEISLPGGSEIAPNLRSITLNFDESLLTTQCVLTRDVQPSYEVVTARGERVGVCWTMNYSASGSTMEPDWATAVQTAYNEGSPSAAASSDYYVKQQYHYNYRATDKFERVYRYFRVPATWNGTLPNSEPVIIDPEVVSATETTSPATFWYPGLRFESYLPLRVDTDYETVTTLENSDALTSDGRIAEFRRPFATHFVSMSQRAYLMHKPEAAQTYGAQPEQTERQWAVQVRMQEENLGVILDVTGAPQHVIAEDEFSAADESDEADWQAEIDWKDIYVTVYMLTDQFAEKTWPTPRAPAPIDIDRKLTIDIPGKRQIWIVPETIIDVNSDGALKRSDGGWIENDSKELEDIARLTFDWYNRERRAIDVTLHSLDSIATVGQLVTTLGEGATLTDINSVVTAVTMDFRQATTSYRTQYAELDLRGL